MPEGDTIFRAAQALDRALAGRVVTRFESVFPALTRVDVDRPLAGRTIESVTSIGKHLLMMFSGDLVLHTHMRMNGSWHIYPAGARWRRPARDMRIVIATGHVEAVGFNVPVAEFLTSAQLRRHRELSQIGSDLLAPDFERAVVLQRMRARNTDSIDDVLLDQRVLSGIGNVFKSEILFVARMYPFTSVSELDDEALDRILDVSLKLLRANVAAPERTLAPTRGRHTTGRLRRDEQLWVYNRTGKPCLRCGTPIAQRKTGIHARLTFWCPRCQSAK